MSLSPLFSFTYYSGCGPELAGVDRSALRSSILLLRLTPPHSEMRAEWQVSDSQGVSSALRSLRWMWGGWVRESSFVVTG